MSVMAMSTPHHRPARRSVLAAPLIRRLPAPLVLASCALTIAVGCGSDDEQSTRRPASVRAEATPSPDLASRVVEGDEFVGLRLVPADGNEVQTDPGGFSAAHPGLYANAPDAVIALRRDGFVAGAGKHFEPPQRRWSMAASIAVQMGDAKGARAEAKRQFTSAFAPCPGEPRCATGIERFEVPRVPGAEAVEIRHKVDGKVLYTTAIVFTKGTFVYQVFAGGPRIDDRRDELIDAAQALYERVPADRPRG
jgi:hypothetical protein